MPGWYIHMEAAKQAIDRLQKGDVPADFPGGPDAAKELGRIAHKWRNYLALGSIGPDFFYLLPDFKPPLGNVIMIIVTQYFADQNQQPWADFEKAWEKYAQPAISGLGAILGQVDGGLIQEMGQAFQNLGNAMMLWLVGLVANLYDWFGVFGSGVPQGFSEKAFYWSDMFHYRKTYQFAHKLFSNAQTEQQKAFALGWITHCATDVTGHPFVNEKVGGPWRLHWQRHHLVENHMDARVYDTQHNGLEPYGELDTSCLHFRLAFRHRNDGDYATPDGQGHDDAPAYDYFAGFPPYDTGDSATADISRSSFFDLDSGDPGSGLPGQLSANLCDFLIKTINDVYPDPAPNGQGLEAPQILRCTNSEFHDKDSGRPSPEALINTFQVLYAYLKFTSTSGYSPAPPSPPPVFNDHSPPSFPNIFDDKARGSDPHHDAFQDFLDLLFAIFAVFVWLVELGVWLFTLPASVMADLLTYGPRLLLYELAVNPLYSLYLAARKPLVMGGFLYPKHDEISPGLFQLGVPPNISASDLAKALESPTAKWPPPILTSEPSGRQATSDTPSAYEVDVEYPRATILDKVSLIATALDHIIHPYCNGPTQPSEFLKPWGYPDANRAGVHNGVEGSMGEVLAGGGGTHPGPWFQGQSAEVLMNTSPGNSAARKEFEQAQSPEASETAADTHFPTGEHLGDPVDYSVYLMGKLANSDPNCPLPDFNLDSDRGYAYHTWDWDRIPLDPTHPPDKPLGFSGCSPAVDFTNLRPCTVPEGYCVTGAPPYDSTRNLDIHFEEKGPNKVCKPAPPPIG